MAAHEPEISVVLPCLNGQATLAECLESILGQEYGDFDVVLFDDGSTDNTLDLARDYAARDSRIRLIPSGRVGLVEALRRSCAEVRAPFLARMDADDIAHPSRLAKQMAYMRTHPETALCGTQVETIGPGIGSGRKRYEEWVNSLVTHEGITRELFVECPIPHPTFLLRRAAYESVGGYQDRDWPEDYDLIMRLYCAGMQLGKVAEPLLKWRHSPDRHSMTSASYGEDRFRALKRFYLNKTYLKDRTVFHQWGAGDVGKRWLREWTSTKPAAVIDINPRKVGREIHGVPVKWPEDLPEPGAGFTLVAVGAPDARDDIRLWFGQRHYRELEDFIFLA